MQRDTAVARIKQICGFRTGNDTEIVNAIQDAQRALEMGTTLPWFLVEEGTTIALTSGNRVGTLPTGFIRFARKRGPHYFPASSTKPTYLEEKDQDEALLWAADQSAAAPRCYVLKKATIEVYPLPDATYTLYTDFYKKDTILDSNLENQWLANVPDLLIGAGGLLIATDLRDNLAIQKAQSLYDVWMKKMLAETYERARANRPLSMGARL